MTRRGWLGKLLPGVAAFGLFLRGERAGSDETEEAKGVTVNAWWRDIGGRITLAPESTYTKTVFTTIAKAARWLRVQVDKASNGPQRPQERERLWVMTRAIIEDQGAAETSHSIPVVNLTGEELEAAILRAFSEPSPDGTRPTSVTLYV